MLIHPTISTFAPGIVPCCNSCSAATMSAPGAAKSRCAAFPASIIAQMMARGEVTSRGATPQEKAIDPDKFVAELTRRNINIKIS